MAKNGNGVVPAAQGIIKGTPDDIPSNLGRSRNQYNWDEFDVGDHKEFSIADAPSARSSATSFARGTKDRPPRNFASRTVEKVINGKKTKVVEIWRLKDPVVGSAASNPNNDNETDTAPASAAE